MKGESRDFSGRARVIYLLWDRKALVSRVRGDHRGAHASDRLFRAKRRDKSQEITEHPGWENLSDKRTDHLPSTLPPSQSQEKSEWRRVLLFGRPRVPAPQLRPRKRVEMFLCDHHVTSRPRPFAPFPPPPHLAPYRSSTHSTYAHRRAISRHVQLRSYSYLGIHANCEYVCAVGQIRHLDKRLPCLLIHLYRSNHGFSTHSPDIEAQDSLVCCIALSWLGYPRTGLSEANPTEDKKFALGYNHRTLFHLQFHLECESSCELTRNFRFLELLNY
jgi:hypothetical protein